MGMVRSEGGCTFVEMRKYYERAGIPLLGVGWKHLDGAGVGNQLSRISIELVLFRRTDV